LQGRRDLEDAGYRADSCLLAGNAFYQAINLLPDQNDLFDVDGLLSAANINSLHRMTQLDTGGAVMVGRRHPIPHRCAAEASPGEEPVDLAVSLAPSLEAVGDDASGQIELGVRIRFAVRVKDPNGMVRLSLPAADGSGS
jgi:hypothetical protein